MKLTKLNSNYFNETLTSARLSSLEMNSSSWVQILDEGDCVSRGGNTVKEGVDRSDLLLWIPTCCIPLKNWPCVAFHSVWRCWVKSHLIPSSYVIRINIIKHFSIFATKQLKIACFYLALESFTNTFVHISMIYPSIFLLLSVLCQSCCFSLS